MRYVMLNFVEFCNKNIAIGIFVKLEKSVYRNRIFSSRLFFDQKKIFFEFQKFNLVNSILNNENESSIKVSIKYVWFYF